MESSNVVFVACASDEMLLCKWLVKWLRKKGFDAQCIDTEKLEYASHPYQYISSLLMKASNVIIICSPRYKDVVSDCENDIEFDGRDKHLLFIVIRHWSITRALKYCFILET